MQGATTLDGYIEKIVMSMDTDAQGFLNCIIPIVMRINIFIVNIDTSLASRNAPSSQKRYVINEFKSHYRDIKMEINDKLNLHDNTLYVIRKDGHYDILVKT